MVHNVEYNWLRFINNPHFRNEKWFLCIKEFSFFENATSISTEKYAIRHWEYVSPTLLKNRRIRMLFDILADSEEQRWLLLRKVQRAFYPEQNPSPFNENLWKEIKFQDINWNTWKANCQVVKWIELSDFWNQKRAWISVELITDSPEFMNTNTQSITWWRNTRFWKRLNTNLWFKREYYREVIDFEWTVDSPMMIELKVVANNPVPNKKINILHEREDTYEWLQLEWVDELNLWIWDTILINTKDRRAYLTQWETTVDITWIITLWSVRPFLKIWENIIAIDTGASEKTIDVNISWNEIF